jgi:outer membrane protein OmpA-like peptidoglycan-associated protein
MLPLNILYKLKIIVLFISIFFSVSLFAQSEKTSAESTIVMTESELKSFLSTIADARREQLKVRENRRLKQDLAELRLKYQERSGIETGGYDNISNQQILRELRYLNQRIDNLSSNARMLPSMNRDNATIIMPGNSSANPMYPASGRNETTIIPSNNRKIKALQNEIDSLKNVEASRANLSGQNSMSDSLNTMSGRLQDVRRQLDSLESKMAAPKAQVIAEASKDNKSYFKQQVYFDNNSETLGAEYLPYIKNLTQLLAEYPEAKVMLEGWASPLGKADYNKQLSMRRSLAVEKAFMNNGIAKSRLLTSFRGEDNSSSEQHARRVEMSIIVQ